MTQEECKKNVLSEFYSQYKKGTVKMNNGSYLFDVTKIKPCECLNNVEKYILFNSQFVTIDSDKFYLHNRDNSNVAFFKLQ